MCGWGWSSDVSWVTQRPAFRAVIDARLEGGCDAHRGHLSIGLDAVLEAVELPAGVAGLDAALANVDADDFTHFVEVFEV